MEKEYTSTLFGSENEYNRVRYLDMNHDQVEKKTKVEMLELQLHTLVKKDKYTPRLNSL